jgi:hypothetical protein
MYIMKIDSAAFSMALLGGSRKRLHLHCIIIEHAWVATIIERLGVGNKSPLELGSKAGTCVGKGMALKRVMAYFSIEVNHHQQPISYIIPEMARKK